MTTPKLTKHLVGRKTLVHQGTTYKTGSEIFLDANSKLAKNWLSRGLVKPLGAAAKTTKEASE